MLIGFVAYSGRLNAQINLYAPPNNITGNVLWTPNSNTHDPYREVIITCGAQLTIDGMVMSFFNNTGIIVQDGGRLFINNTIITPSALGIFWRGIDMMGTGDIINSTLSGAAVGVWIKDIDQVAAYGGGNPSAQISPGVNVAVENQLGIPAPFVYLPFSPAPCSPPIVVRKVLISNTTILNCGIGVFMDHYLKQPVVRVENTNIKSIGLLPSFNNSLYSSSYVNGRPNELFKILQSKRLRASGISIESDAPQFPFFDITGMRIDGDYSHDLRIFENGVSRTRNSFSKLGKGIAGECALNLFNNDFMFYEIDFVEVSMGYFLKLFDKIDIRCNSYVAPKLLNNQFPKRVISLPNIETHNSKFEGLDLYSYGCFYYGLNLTNYNIRQNDLSWHKDFPKFYNDSIQANVSGLGIVVHRTFSEWENQNSQGNNFITGNRLYISDPPTSLIANYSNYHFGISFLGDVNFCFVSCNTFEHLFVDLLLFNSLEIPSLGTLNPLYPAALYGDIGSSAIANNNIWSKHGFFSSNWSNFMLRELAEVNWPNPSNLDDIYIPRSNVYRNSISTITKIYVSNADNTPSLSFSSGWVRPPNQSSPFVYIRSNQSKPSWIPDYAFYILNVSSLTTLNCIENCIFLPHE